MPDGGEDHEEERDVQRQPQTFGRGQRDVVRPERGRERPGGEERRRVRDERVLPEQQRSAAPAQRREHEDETADFDRSEAGPVATGSVSKNITVAKIATPRARS